MLSILKLKGQISIPVYQIDNASSRILNEIGDCNLIKSYKNVFISIYKYNKKNNNHEY